MRERANTDSFVKTVVNGKTFRTLHHRPHSAPGHVDVDEELKRRWSGIFRKMNSSNKIKKKNGYKLLISLIVHGLLEFLVSHE